MTTSQFQSGNVLDDVTSGLTPDHHPSPSQRLKRNSRSRSSSDSMQLPNTGADSLSESVNSPLKAHWSAPCSTPAVVISSGATNNNNNNSTDTSSNVSACGGGAGGGLPGAEMMATPPASVTNLARRQSYKDQRRVYRDVKRRAADEMLSTLRDPTVVVRSAWLKVRGTLKGWAKVWAVLKPGLLVLYKSEKAKTSHWLGTVMLSSCQLIERPSKKDGFCFKLFHPLDQNIWSAKGPDGETHSVGLFSLPASYLICRVSSQSVGKCWMDALELTISCSSTLLKRSLKSTAALTAAPGDNTGNQSQSVVMAAGTTAGGAAHTGDEEACDACEVFGPYLLSAPVDTGSTFEDVTDDAGPHGDGDESSDLSLTEEPKQRTASESDVILPPETVYTANVETVNTDCGGSGQTEELADDNKSLLWCLLKQLRPGMDLSRVVLPTFILEPRSFLDKLSDYYYHADYLARVVTMDDPYQRIKNIVGWYLSGFYKKPKGLKKPYNPILGETFRCYWQHPNGSKTFYIAEQVSHHPPMSAFYVSNRREGFCISCTILAKSKFYGNSTSAILDGVATLTLLPRGEVYRMNMPYVHCKGVLLGTLSVELGGKVEISCEKTGYSAELDFKLKPFLSGLDECNRVVGKIRLGRDTLATVDGKWDSKITCSDKRTGETETLWEVTEDVKRQRLQRYTVSADRQGEFESERLWRHVSQCIASDDQQGATEQKFVLEEAQRAAARDRQATNSDWNTKHFLMDNNSSDYMYRYADLRPWDPHSDLFQYESEYQILSKTRLRSSLLEHRKHRSTSANKCKKSAASLRAETAVDSGGISQTRRRGADLSPTSASGSCRTEGTGGIDSSSPESGSASVTKRSPLCSRSCASVMSQQQAELARMRESFELLQKSVTTSNNELAAIRRLLQQRPLSSNRTTTGVAVWLVPVFIACLLYYFVFGVGWR